MQRKNGLSKINRLLEMITILLNRKKITASDLAERFNVSTRTIYRDIDMLTASGIPIYTMPGLRGGIILMEGDVQTDDNITPSEYENLTLALKTLQVTKFPVVEAMLEKLNRIFTTQHEDWISIDFSTQGNPPGEGVRKDAIERAIQQSEKCIIDYIDSENIRTRQLIIPLRLMYQNHAWYLWTWCPEKKFYHTYRVSRIKKMTTSDRLQDYAKLQEIKPELPDGKQPETTQTVNAPILRLLLRFQPEALYRLYNDYDDNLFIRDDDGTYRLEIVCAEEEWIYEYLMSFGPSVEVLEPTHIRSSLLQRAQTMMRQYSQ